MQTLKKTRRKHKTNSKQQQQNIKQLEGQHKTDRNTGYPAHEPPRQINISKGLAGRFRCFSVFVMFSLEFVLCFFLRFYMGFCSIVNATT